MKRFLSLVLAISFALPIEGFSESNTAAPAEGFSSDNTVVIEAKNASGAMTRTTVTAVSENNEVETLRLLHEMSADDPGAVTYLMAHEDNLRSYTNENDHIFAASSEEDIPAMKFIPASWKQKWETKVKPIFAKLSSRTKENRAGFVIAVASGSGMGGAVYFLSDSYVAAGGAFAVQFLPAYFTAVFSHEWLTKSRQNGRRLSKALASYLGKPDNVATKLLLQKIGQAGTAYTLNLGTSTALLALSGDLFTLSGIVSDVTQALVASSESLDMVLERYFHGRKMEIMAMFRVIAFGICEVASMYGLTDVKYGAGFAVGAVLMNLVFSKQLYAVARAAVWQYRNTRNNVVIGAMTLHRWSGKKFDDARMALFRKYSFFKKFARKHCEQLLIHQGREAA
jgi:hypothetical protein